MITTIAKCIIKIKNAFSLCTIGIHCGKWGETKNENWVDGSTNHEFIRKAQTRTCPDCGITFIRHLDND